MNNVTVEVFYTETCPNCPAQKELARRFEADASVRLTDAAKNQGRAENHGVRAVPTTVIDGPALDQKLGFTGVMKEDKLDTAVRVAAGEAAPDALEPDSVIDTLKEKLL